MAMKTPEKQILPIAPAYPDLNALTKWAGDLTRTLQQNLATIARKANDHDTVPLTGNLNASGFDITNIGNLGNISGTITYKGADIDNRYVNVTGDTMTGNLAVAKSSAVLSYVSNYNSVGGGALFVGPGGITQIQFDDAHSFAFTKQPFTNITNGTFSSGTVIWTLSNAGLVTQTGPLDISNAAAGQIVFPATQNASAGANTLDDYEEGTWTPTLAFNGASTGITYTTQAGNYIKIGKLVFVQGRVIISSKGSSTGSASIRSLPFTATGQYFPGPVGFYTGFSGLTSTPVVYAEASNTFLNVMHGGATTIAALNDANFTNTSDIIFSAVYIASA